MSKIFTNIGGRCMGFYSLRHISKFNDEYSHLDCPTGNMLYYNGFCDAYKLFDGSLYDNLLIKKRGFKRPSSTQKYNTRVGNVLVGHGLYFDEKYQKRLDEMFKTFHKTLNKEKKNVIYTYTLNEYDVYKSVFDIVYGLSNLSKYINIDNLFILASKPVDNPDYKNFKYDYRSNIFKTVFRDRYFVIEPSNDHYEACKNFYEKFEKYQAKIKGGK